MLELLILTFTKFLAMLLASWLICLTGHIKANEQKSQNDEVMSIGVAAFIITLLGMFIF